MGENVTKRSYFETARKDLEIHRELQGRIEDIFQIADDFVDFSVCHLLAKFNDDEELVEVERSQSQQKRLDAFRAAQRNLWETIDQAEATVTPGISLRSLWDRKFAITSSNLGNSGDRSLTVHVARIFGLYKYRIADDRSIASSEFTSLTSRLRASVHDEQAYQDVQVIAEQKILAVLQTNFDALKVGLRSDYEGFQQARKDVDNRLAEISETLILIPKEVRSGIDQLDPILQEIELLAANVDGLEADDYNADSVQLTKEELDRIKQQLEVKLDDIRELTDEYFAYADEIDLGTELIDDAVEVIERLRKSIAENYREGSFAKYVRAEMILARHGEIDAQWHAELRNLVAGMIVSPDPALMHSEFDNPTGPTRWRINIGLAFLFDLARIYPEYLTNLLEPSNASRELPQEFKPVEEWSDFIDAVPSRLGFYSRETIDPKQHSLLAKCVYMPINQKRAANQTSLFYNFNDKQARIRSSIISVTTPHRESASPEEIADSSHISSSHFNLDDEIPF